MYQDERVMHLLRCIPASIRFPNVYLRNHRNGPLYIYVLNRVEPAVSLFLVSPFFSDLPQTSRVSPFFNQKQLVEKNGLIVDLDV